jgi:DNA-directed RNA polymerase subunit RPC12/RpoP
MKTSDHISKITADHIASCSTCSKEIMPSETMFIEGRKSYCEVCGAKVMSAWENYYNDEEINKLTCEGCSSPLGNSEDDRLCQSCYDEQIAGCMADMATEKRCQEFYEGGC